MTTKASKPKLKNMVMQFRIVELQTLLETFGETDLKLRKKELQNKALQILVTKKSRLLTNMIKDLYEKMNSNRRSSDTRDSSREFYNYPDSSFRYDDDFYAADAFSDIHFPDHKNSEPVDLTESVNPSPFEQLDADRLKSIRFPDLPFFQHISDIMLVTPLVPKSESDALFEFKCTFSVNEDICHYLFSPDEKDSKYEVMLRLGQLNAELEVEDALPQKLYLTINDRFCSCVPDTYKNKYDPTGKRPGAPMNITPYIDRSSIIHKLIINWSNTYQISYGFNIQLVKKKETDELIKNLAEKGEQDPAVSKKFIYNNLNDEDNEIATTSLKISLVCPLGKMLMTLPSRGTTCNHLQCFDGALYIKMNEIKSTWLCPVCSKHCLYENLIVDGYFMEILRSEKFKSDIREVQLALDGSWEPVIFQETKKRPNSLSPVKDSEKKVKLDEETDDEDSDSSVTEVSFVEDLKEIFSNFIGCKETRSHYPEFSIYDDDIPPRSLNSAQQSSSTLKEGFKKNVLTVDLTISDSDSNKADDENDDDDDDVKSTSSSSSKCTPTDYYIDRVRNNLIPYSGENLCSPLKENHLPPNSTPPIYDIDSDS